MNDLQQLMVLVAGKAQATLCLGPIKETLEEYGTAHCGYVIAGSVWHFDAEGKLLGVDKLRDLSQLETGEPRDDLSGPCR